MCGRTPLAVDVATLTSVFGATPADDVTIPKRYNIAPRDDLVVIQNDAPEEMHLLEWRLLPAWVDDPEDSPRPINARSETVHEKPMFRSAFQERRCLILADGFYEWQGRRGSKQPYRIERADGDPLAFAGLWESWGKNGATKETCTILTCDANDVVGGIHDRMPVMLEPDERDIWLGDGEPDEWRPVLDPYPDDFLRTFPLSKRVNNPANDSPEVIEPIDIGDQSGLGDFGAD